MTERLYNKTKLEETIKEINFNINEQCILYGRDPKDVKAMAASKKVPANIINDAFNLGVTLIGENRVQELIAKKDSYCFGRESVHFIGQLQTNKVRSLLPHVDVVQSLDSLKLATQINRCAAQLGRNIDCFVEVNICKEPLKGGIYPELVEEFLYQISELKNIKVKGLMTIGQKTSDLSKKEDIFHKMNSLFIDIRAKKLDNVNMETLSMGMSEDFLLAIKYNSNIVRLGRALFGERM